MNGPNTPIKNREQEGILILLARTLLAGAFPVLVVSSYKSVLPMDVLIWSTFFSAIFFASIVTARGRWSQVGSFDIWKKDIFWIVLIIGVGYQMLFFLGLGATTAGNASIIALVEIFFSYLFFHILRREHIPFSHVAGSLLIVAGVGIILSPKFDGFHRGDVLIMAASAVAPLGNFFQRRIRTKMSSEAVHFLRSVFSFTALAVIGMFFRAHSPWEQIRDNLWLLAVNGVFMLGVMKFLWLEAIHRVSVTKANALGSLAPVVTLLIVWFFMREAPTDSQIYSLVPVLAGFFLLNRR